MNSFVRTGRVLDKKQCFCAGKKRYMQFEIGFGENEGVESGKFHAGEYLMIRTHNREVGWPYPYMIHGKTQRGYLVLACQDQDLFRCSVQDSIEYWGPRGTSPLDGEEVFTLIAEPATLFLVWPFMTEKGMERMILIDPNQIEIFPAPGNAVYCENLKEAWETKVLPEGKVLVALNPGNVKELWDLSVADPRMEDVYLYVTNKKACGINACKGCYLHSPKEKFGINVCCKGPFMPLGIIDFEADGKSFESYSID